MSDTLDIIIRPDGAIEYVYSDDLAAVFVGEKQETRRASNVEPASGYGLKTGWVADMAPVGGCLLARTLRSGKTVELEPLDGTLAYIDDLVDGFATRQDALDAEREWIRAHLGL